MMTRRRMQPLPKDVWLACGVIQRYLSRKTLADKIAVVGTVLSHINCGLHDAADGSERRFVRGLIERCGMIYRPGSIN